MGILCEQFDLLDNSLAILSGVASSPRAERIIIWIEAACLSMRNKGELAFDLPLNFSPFIEPEDHDWRIRYEKYNMPDEYHNGGIWPFIGGFYVAALVGQKGTNWLRRSSSDTLSTLITSTALQPVS